MDDWIETLSDHNKRILTSIIMEMAEMETQAVEQARETAREIKAEAET